MQQKISHVALLVKDYDEALDFYLNKLHFRLVADLPIHDGKRWVLVAPSGDGTCSLLLAKAGNDDQEKWIGNQTGGRVFLFLYTDNFDRDYQNLLEHDIKVIRKPIVEPYGKVAVFEDLYGNLWDLIQPKIQDAFSMI